MENFKNNCEDLKYLASELQTTLYKIKSDIPEDFFKVLLDLIYHTNTIIKEMENEYEQFIETWDNSSS
jgi:hypothetical protein